VGVGSRFHVLRARSRFWLYRGSQIPFSCFARPDLFSAVPRVSGPVYMFCAPVLVFGANEGVGSRFHVLRARTLYYGTEGVWSRFHDLRAWTHFLHYRGRRVPFSCFARPDSFSAVPRASVPIFIFLRARTRFYLTRGRLVVFSCFALPDSFSAIPRASGPVLMYCGSDTFSAVPRAFGPVFMFC
jgi:hypothetical protein